MKKLHFLLLAAGLAFIVEACRHYGPHVVIKTSDNNKFEQVEYTGRIIFSEDKRNIESMSPDGYFRYKNNNDKLVAECDKQGKITYQLNGNQVSGLNDQAQQLVFAAVAEIEKTRKK